MAIYNYISWEQNEHHLLHSHKLGELEDIEERRCTANVLQYISGVYEKLEKAYLCTPLAGVKTVFQFQAHLGAHWSCKQGPCDGGL